GFEFPCTGNERREHTMKTDSYTASKLAQPSLLRPAVDIPRPRKKKTLRYSIYGAVGVLFLGGASVGLRRLRAAAPSVDAQTVWIDTVKRGPMLRDVQGQGTLVPEDIRWITAVSGARVERILAHPGDKVTADTALIELANPDVQLAALEADRQ